MAQVWSVKRAACHHSLNALHLQQSWHQWHLQSMHEAECLHHDWADHLRCGAGTFAGNDVTYSGGLATFQSIYGTAKGSHSVTGTRIVCESDSAGRFVVIHLLPRGFPIEEIICSASSSACLRASDIPVELDCCLMSLKMVDVSNCDFLFKIALSIMAKPTARLQHAMFHQCN